MEYLEHYAGASFLTALVMFFLVVLTIFIDKIYIAAIMRDINQRLGNELIPIMGEGKKIYMSASTYLELPFTYLRKMLYLATFFIPIMFFLNIAGHKEWNLAFSVLIVLLAVKIALRWQVLAIVMFAGAFENLLQSTKDKPEDISTGAREGLIFFAKVMLALILAVWFTSIILAIISFEHAPISFFLVMLGLAGIYLYAFLSNIPTWRKVRHTIVMLPFLILIWMGMTALLDVSPTTWLSEHIGGLEGLQTFVSTPLFKVWALILGLIGISALLLVHEHTKKKEDKTILTTIGNYGLALGLVLVALTFLLGSERMNNIRNDAAELAYSLENETEVEVESSRIATLKNTALQFTTLGQERTFIADGKITLLNFAPCAVLGIKPDDGTFIVTSSENGTENSIESRSGGPEMAHVKVLPHPSCS